MKILAVDDEQDILDILVQALTASGLHEVITALSAKEALARIAETEIPFDCCLIDIQMPSINGITLTQLIRQTPGYELQPIVIITAMHQKSYLDAAFKAGATDFVTKPFNLAALKSHIQEAQRVAFEKKRSQTGTYAEGELKRLGVKPKKLRLDYAFKIQGVPSAVDCREFENYVLQLSNRHLAGAIVSAMTIEGVEGVYDELSSEEFCLVVGQVAQSIHNVLCKSGGVLSYRGKGTFLCVGPKRFLATQAGIENAINRNFVELAPKERGARIMILVGKQVPLKSVSDFDAIASLSEAVENVEKKAVLLPNFFTRGHRLPNVRRVSQEEKRLEQRGYEVLLNEALSEMDGAPFSKRYN
ncbi:response regulator [Aliiroseovarius sp. KMU-50]|uniref:Response regulator n=1 Tax=Aliiroseovarius salicola TaxID=3009082 RepID=A0ABT4VZI9_9RHOB|nr:response regulator [Aliiroseovarius sp. KMU-50]MDA5093669.1 response regulator [Aliiroseovarius sp. KMU-50]